MGPLQDSTHFVNDGSALQKQMAEDGYVYLRGVLPALEVTSLHRELCGILHRAGWLLPSAPIEQGIAAPGIAYVDPEPEYLAVIESYNESVAFNALSHHASLMSLFERLLGDKVLVHPNVLPRNIVPQLEEYTTPAHQDFPNIQGTEEVYTTWIPLMDCPPDVGGLQVAKGSHKGGVYDFGIGNGAGGIEIIEPFDGQWVGGALSVGDVLVFHSMTVHKGIPNRSDRIRMSIDARYQRVSDPYNPNIVAKPYGHPDTWDALYARWPDTLEARALQYYWRRYDLKEKPFDTTWFDKRDALGFALGERKDPRSRSVLLRILKRDADPAKRARAETLLNGLSAS